MMKLMRASSYKRINITLPVDTVRLIDQTAGIGNRSKLLDTAVRAYVHEQGKTALRRALREGSIARFEQNRRLAEEWFSLDEEVWHTRNKK